MDYQKFVGMHIWVPEAGPVDADGHNAEICWVHPGGSTPDRLCVNARALKQVNPFPNMKWREK